MPPVLFLSRSVIFYFQIFYFKMEFIFLYAYMGGTHTVICQYLFFVANCFAFSTLSVLAHWDG
jgi:hypothetical protein